MNTTNAEMSTVLQSQKNNKSKHILPRVGKFGSFHGF